MNININSDSNELEICDISVLCNSWQNIKNALHNANKKGSFVLKDLYEINLIINYTNLSISALNTYIHIYTNTDSNIKKVNLYNETNIKLILDYKLDPNTMLKDIILFDTGILNSNWNIIKKALDCASLSGTLSINEASILYLDCINIEIGLNLLCKFQSDAIIKAQTQGQTQKQQSQET